MSGDAQNNRGCGRALINHGQQAQESGHMALGGSFVVSLTPCLSLQISMGQNQDKLEGGEQAISEGLEETRPCPNSGDAGSHTGDVMGGGSFCEEEAGNTRENSGEPDVQELDGSPGQEPTTPSTEKHINLWVSPFAAREVRQGGAAGKEGGGGGGEGGRTASVVPQETDENQKSCTRFEERARAYKVYNQIKKDKKTEEELHTSSKIKMDYQDEESRDESFPVGVSCETFGLAVTSEDANLLGNTEEDSVLMKTSRCGTHAGSELLLSVQQDQNDTIMADVAGEDIKLCAGTVGRLSERKGLPTAQPQHPLKNRLQKESLSDMSDTIHCRPTKQKTENNTKKETLSCEMKPGLNDYSSTEPKVIDTDDQRESLRPYQQMDASEATANQKIGSNSASNPASPTEPSSILERLLKRNRKETSPALSEIKEVDINDKDATDVTAKRVLDSAAAELPTDKLDQSDVNTSVCDMEGLKEKPRKENLAAKDHHIKRMVMKQRDMVDTSDEVCCQPGVMGNTMCESSLTNTHCTKADCQSSKNINPTDASAKEDMEIKPNVSPSNNPSSDNSQSAVSHESRSCEVSGVIAEESAPSSLSHAKSPPTKSDGQIVDPDHLLATEKTDTSTVRPALLKRSDSERKADLQLSGSACSDDPSVRRKKVKTSTEDTAAPAVDTGSVLVAAGTVTSEESHQVTAGIKQDLLMTLNAGNMTADQPDRKLVKESDDSVSMRDKSQTTPKSRPVSELIKETIQLHEKLQHQDWPKPAEVKSDEQGQSVKVAQMKAAFDSAQKSPDKAVERKPSMRKGKDKI